VYNFGMFIALGADHAGFELKEALKPMLDARGVRWRDFGTTSTASVDYPDFASAVAQAVASGSADRGILVCGSGIGMAIAANKVAGIRAASILDSDEGQIAREHNDINVLAIGSRRTPAAEAERILDVFLGTPFAGGRHTQRVQKIQQIESRILRGDQS
jgi:ribose 5-phosphate isomerase B